MGYFERVKEIQQLQCELFIDYWYSYIGLILLGIVLFLLWIIKKQKYCIEREC
ncbi:hypothetical protein G3A_06655 [Bacillus sp. 17376]|uniref:Uncharacterized protein n=1 Tax=Mesobacillus boroniphilus JCM 21738 TaxID=1294265 RepID=W4RKU2_9BACI|nr:hypothetical protein G3A_06655 [Bacillus sp. 17376]GAE44772.1 hypothetical protein JCM21738_1511 [Mesobacillus boroniphilus JCM 21738]